MIRFAMSAGQRRKVHFGLAGALAMAGVIGLVDVPGLAGVPAAYAQPTSADVTDAAEPPSCPAAPSEDPADPAGAVRYLADDALEGRLAGSEGAWCAGTFIAERFERLGLEPEGEDGGYFQELPLASAINPHAPSGNGRNVVALLPGADPALAAEVVILGAHYDHLGWGPFGSLSPESREIHNGADDNASGVAALLSAAGRLAVGPRPARSILFLAFTGEEFGLLGSSYYVGHPVRPLEKTVAMLNMDMVGRLEGDPLIVYGTGTAAEWEELISAAVAVGDVEVAFQDSGYGPSDHTSFYSNEVPVLHFFTNVHGDYHKPSDDVERIDFAGLERVAALVADVALRVADRPMGLTLLRTEAPPPASQEGGYGPYLGTVPDFAPVDYGVRLSGVRAGSPAEGAGMQAGDVIVRFGGTDIADLYAFTDALRAHSTGDTVTVVVLRDGEELALLAVLGER